MSHGNKTMELPSAMEAKLARVRARQVTLAVLRALAIGGAVALAAMTAAMLIDWLVTLFATGVRTALTATCLILTGAAALATGIPSLVRALRRTRAASDVDAAIPQLEERWTTVVMLSATAHRPATPTARAMFKQVASEAAAMERIVQPPQVAGMESLRRPGWLLAACALALGAFLASDWPQTSVLLRRFWSPASDITATRVRMQEGDRVVPRGESVALTAELTGVPRSSARLSIVRDSGAEETIELAPDPENPKSFAHRLRVDDSFRYRVLAGDGQTEWHAITAVDYPVLDDVRLTITAPEYAHRPVYEKKLLPGRVRVLAGSRMELRMKPAAPLERLELTLTPESADDAGDETTEKEAAPVEPQVLLLTPDADGWYRYEAQLVDDVALSPRLWSRDGLGDEERRVCRIQVFADAAPVARVLGSGIEAAAFDEVLEVPFEAHDDVGIARAELVIYDETDPNSPPKILQVLPIPLGEQLLEKHVQATVELDLKSLDLAPGAQISYAIRVADNRTEQIDAQAAVAMKAEARETAAREAESVAKAQSADASAADSPAIGSQTADENRTESLAAAEGANPMETTAAGDGDPMPSDSGTDERMPSETESSTTLADATRARPDARTSADPAAAPAAGDSPMETDRPSAATGEMPTGDPTPEPTPGEPNGPPPEGPPASPDQSPSDQAPPNAAPRGKALANAAGSDAPPPPVTMARNPLSGEEPQNVESSRRRLRITERLAAVASSDERRAERTDIRQRVVRINERLGEVEAGLFRLENREIADADRSEQFRRLDARLGDVESAISELRNDTRDQQFAFVGLQMVDIGRTHVTPARERVFVGIREPAAGGDGSAAAALPHVVRARELLTALLTRYDRVARDDELAAALDEAATMYEVYVERSQQLLREARQNRNPLDRAMAIIEVDQDYLDRYAEVLSLRREMMAEFGRILGDDPRLLARYMDLIKRRRQSLRDQLSELAERQAEIADELSGWQQVGDDQRSDLLALLGEYRLQGAGQLAKDAAELSERLEKQLPLVLEPSQGTAAVVVGSAREIAATAARIALNARRQVRQPEAALDLRPDAGRLVELFVDLDAAMDQLTFEHEGDEEVTDYVTSRLLESRTVADQADAWAEVVDQLQRKAYHRLAEADQQALALATELLRVDMLGLEEDLAAEFQRQMETGVPAAVVDLIQELHGVMESITFQQAAATFALSENRMDVAETQQAAAGAGFERAEALFDRIRREVIDALDAAETPDPSIADLEDPTLDEFLAQLEREPNIEAQLGLPNRPRNLRVIAEGMLWQQSGGDMLGDASQAARSRARRMLREPPPDSPPTGNPGAERPDTELTAVEREQRRQAAELEAALAESLARAQQRADDPMLTPEERRAWQQKADDLEDALNKVHQGDNASNAWRRIAAAAEGEEVLKALARGDAVPDEQWNKLLSTLDDGLGQVGGRTPPDEYRRAIEQYQERIRRLLDPTPAGGGGE